MADQPLANLRRVVFVIDTGQNVRACLEELWTCFQALRALVPASANSSVYLLGREQPLSGAELPGLGVEGLARLPSPCSLLAPVFRHLISSGPEVSALILMSAGEVFDLDDWLGHFMIDRWVLVNVGRARSRKSWPGLPEVLSNQLNEARRLMSLPPYSKHSPAFSASVVSDLSSFHWEVDGTGFPMILIEPLERYVQLFPVTRVQLEAFSASSAGAIVDDRWYEERGNLTPRVSYREIRRDNYEGLFAIGITPSEAESFAEWLSRDSKSYSLLTEDEWKCAYRWLSTKSPTGPPPIVTDTAALAIWQFILDKLPARDLGQMSLASQGIMEWVCSRRGREGAQYFGLGLPRPQFATQPFRTIFEPAIPLVERPRSFGFRLIVR
jgi:hypothetical protein